MEKIQKKPDDIILRLKMEQARLGVQIAKKELENAYDLIVKELKLPNVSAINEIDNLDDYRTEQGL